MINQVQVDEIKPLPIIFLVECWLHRSKKGFVQLQKNMFCKVLTNCQVSVKFQKGQNITTPFLLKSYEEKTEMHIVIHWWSNLIHTLHVQACSEELMYLHVKVTEIWELLYNLIACKTAAWTHCFCAPENKITNTGFKTTQGLVKDDRIFLSKGSRMTSGCKIL